MLLTFIPPTDLPVEYCAHARWNALYRHREGIRSPREDGLYTYYAYAGFTIPRVIGKHIFHHSECLDCEADITEHMAFR